MDKILAPIHEAVSAAFDEEIRQLREHYPDNVRGGAVDDFQRALSTAGSSLETLVEFWNAPGLIERFANGHQLNSAAVFGRMLGESELPGFALEYCRPSQVPPLRIAPLFSPLPLFSEDVNTGTGIVLTSLPFLHSTGELLEALAQWHGLRAVSLVCVLPASMRAWCQRQRWKVDPEPAAPAAGAGAGQRLPVPFLPLTAFRPPMKEAPWINLPPSLLTGSGLIPVWCSETQVTFGKSSALTPHQEADLRSQMNGAGLIARFISAPDADVNAFVETIRGVELEQRAQKRSRSVQQFAAAPGANAEIIDVQLLQKGGVATLDATVEIVQTLLLGAIRRRASDLVFKQLDNGNLRVRYNVNDSWEDVPGTWGAGSAETIIARLKVLSELPMDRRLKPMDGSITVLAKTSSGQLQYRFRLNIVRDKDGQRATLRPANDSAVPTLDSLAMPEPVHHFVRRVMRRSNGLFIVTGPTGSGKTTTLHAAVDSVNKPHLNIITVESPVERSIPGINQIEVPEVQPEDPGSANALSFAEGLRSILRQKPHIILVGEIRDNETAQIGLGAANTGHLVLSTLHTNRAYDAVLRLLSMGVNPVQMSETLCGVLAQRLVRLCCLNPDCTKRVALTEDLLAEYALPRELFTIGQEVVQDYNHEGCFECTKGVSGRRAIFEVLTLEKPAERTLLTAVALASHHGRSMPGGHESPGDALAERMKALGYPSMLENACELAARCEIPLEEAAKFL